jgi:FkbM family methyltransferase
MKYYAQGNQDIWVLDLFKDYKNKTYVDVGAMDGITYSNTYLLEKSLEWSGICIEPNKQSFHSLKSIRNSININCAVTNYNGTCKISNDSGPLCHVSESGIEEVECYRLEDILNINNCPSIINYLSIDIEGYEYNVLKDFDFSKYFVQVITLEHNLYCEGDKNKNLLFGLLINNGFIRVVDNAVCLDSSPHVYNQPYEDWYINLKCIDLLNNPISKIQPR